MSTKLEIPAQPVMMQTNRDYRLSSLNGFVINFKADEPARVPPHVYEEAFRIGAVVVGECEAPQENTDGFIRGAKEAGELEAEAKRGHVKQACIALMARDDSTDFKADGYPKLNKVTAEIPPECPKPTAGEVMEAMDELRKDVNLADLD